MISVGLYHIALLPTAEEDAFINRMAELGDGPGIFQLTRVTSGFDTLLLRRPGPLPIFAWHVTARLVTSVTYDFEENVEALQQAIAEFGVVFAVDTYTVPVGD
jgi:hypothetical protein